MFLEDAPLEELSTTIKTLMKDVVDNALFKQVKFYWSPQELNHVMGYVFLRIGQNGKGMHDKLERTRLWAAGCDYISTQTCELRQHLYDWWYAIGYGKFVFLFSFFITTALSFLFEFHIRPHLCWRKKYSGPFKHHEMLKLMNMDGTSWNKMTNKN